ncbi:MAG TPA: hypothetical protein ENI22_01830 [Candidatus Pacearchaeota archaeon]|nr:hypothetical protein [Candidatus Pacearchaeota archaeon]
MPTGIEIISQIWDVISFILIWFWWAILLLWIFILKLMWKSWPVDVVIIEKRGNNLIKTNDRAGRYTDSFSGITGYKLQKSKDTIPIVDFNWVLHNVAIPTTIFDRIINFIRGNVGTLFLFRYGSKQYKPLHITEKKDNKIVYQEILDEKGQPIYIKVYQPFDPRDRLGVIDFEVVDWDNMNFMVQEQRASVDRRRKKGEWLKQLIVPIALMAITAVVCIVMIKFAFDFATSVKSSNVGASDTRAQPPDIPIISDIFTPGE